MNRASSALRANTAILLLAAVLFIVHLLCNGNYGFHRDELQVLDDARHLAWGYVAYPPLTAFFGRIELLLFGTSLTGFRFFSALAQCVAVVLAGLIAGEQFHFSIACTNCRAHPVTIWIGRDYYIGIFLFRQIDCHC